MIDALVIIPEKYDDDKTDWILMTTDGDELARGSSGDISRAVEKYWIEKHPSFF